MIVLQSPTRCAGCPLCTRGPC